MNHDDVSYGAPDAPTSEQQAEARDTHRGGSSYEASMLLNLLARIHRDGGHYVEQHGLDKAIEDADAQVVQWLTMQERLADALFVLSMVDKNNRIDAGEKGKAWSGRFVVEEVRRVLAGAPSAASAT